MLAILASIVEAITTIATITQVIVTTIARAIAIVTILSAHYSNTYSRLYISRNIYNESISIKEIYSFLI